MNGSVRYRSMIIPLDEAITRIQNHQRVFISGNAATPTPLLETLARHGHRFENVEIIYAHLLGTNPLADPALEGHFRLHTLFVGPGDREAVNEGRVDHIPVHLHKIPRLFRSGIVPIDVAIVHTSPPDEHGFLSLGVECIASRAAVDAAGTVIALVNPRMPRTLGDTFIHLSQVDAIVEIETPLHELQRRTSTDIEKRIARYVAELIDDGCTLQLGIGGIPDAVLGYLHHYRDLGIHSEMISDGVMELIEAGIITGRRKTLHPGKVIATFVYGTQQLYEFVNNNPIFEIHPCDYTNNPFIIAQNEAMVAINSAIEIDLTGQVCSDSIGTRIYSGFGGQVDFIRGAAHSRNGRPIIALPSTALNGTVSRIVPLLKPGAGVVTTRADVHYVVTEYGIASLFGKTLRERARALIDIAHPTFREDLERAAYERGLLTHPGG